MEHSAISMQYIAIGIASLLVIYLWKRQTRVADPPPVTDVKHSCISIASTGGFDRLCHTDARYGVIGANVRGIKPGILPQHPCKYDDAIKRHLVMVDVHAFGLNYADVCIRWGLYASANDYVGYPITPGFEFSGVVVWIGDGDAPGTFKIGDRVFGVSLFGSYSTHVVVPDHQLFHKPQRFSMSEAAGFLCTAFTAYYALFCLAAPSDIPYVKQRVTVHTNTYLHKHALAGQTSVLKRPPKCVLIHSASGGVGSVLVMLCKAVACYDVVVGVVGGAHKVVTARNLGCDVVIDRKSDSLKNGNIWDEMKAIIADFEGFDIVFDANGVSTLKQSYQNLKAAGKLVVYGFHSMLPSTSSISPLQWIKITYNALRTPSFDPMKLTTLNKSVMGFNLSFLFSRTDILQIAMADLSEWIEAEEIGVCKVTQYKMENVADAHRDIQSGKTVGKLVMITPFHSDYK